MYKYQGTNRSLTCFINQMNSFTIQGVNTGSFQFRHNSGQGFRSLVESLVMNSATLISSKYRIDLIYNSETDRQDDILKLWCTLTGKKFNIAVKQKFLKSRGRHETLEHYFTSLIYLARMPAWFSDYSRQLNLVLLQEPNHPIHKDIVGCARHLAKQKNSIHLPLDATDKYGVAQRLIKNMDAFASSAAQGYLKN
jgi:hypothetical protein